MRTGLVSLSAALVSVVMTGVPVVAADTNEAPSVSVQMSDYNPVEIPVFASASFTDPESDTETYTCTVDYGDGTVVAGTVTDLSCAGPEHLYLIGGSYTVTVTVTDSGGASGVGTSGATYNNWAPSVVGLGLVGDIRVGGTAHAVTAIVDPGSGFETYNCTIDYGDGSPILTGEFVPVWPEDDLPRCVYPDHVYAAIGDYTLTAVVTDSGGASGSAQYIETIIPAPTPDLSVTAPDEVNEGSPVAASATFEPANADETHRCSVDYGDGAGPQSGVVTGSICQGPSHVYGRPGTFTIVVSLTGSLSPSASASKSILVWNVAPAMSGFSITPGFAKPGSPVTASIAFTDPGSTETYTVMWDWGDGSSTTMQLRSAVRSATSKHVYSKAGLYTVSMMLSDGPATDWPAWGVVGIYDSARSLSGSGSVAVPAGTCLLSAKCAGAARGTFSVSASYAKGATRPSVCFTYSATGFTFTSTGADWFVAAGGMATIQGHGRVNGTAGYSYGASAVDGRPDSFALQVWTSAGALVYDLEPAPLKTGWVAIK